ncbi:hypothetical protein CF319_g6929 [Tilletia indica]|nr:hypothetical protein CF319_g6929 [Tilletia indica]
MPRLQLGFPNGYGPFSTCRRNRGSPTSFFSSLRSRGSRGLKASISVDKVREDALDCIAKALDRAFAGYHLVSFGSRQVETADPTVGLNINLEMEVPAHQTKQDVLHSFKDALGSNTVPDKCRSNPATTPIVKLQFKRLYNLSVDVTLNEPAGTKSQPPDPPPRTVLQVSLGPLAP